jgi:shikimate kinase
VPAPSGATEPARTTPAVVLIGPPAAGKSRLGRRLSRLLDLPLIDTDRLVVEAHGPIPQIFAEHGEPVFRAWEREAVAAALQQRAVVSLGGGAVLDPATQQQLGGLPVVLLTLSAEAAAARLDGSSRPLAGGVEAWTALVAARAPLYERLATASWDTSRRPLDRIAQEIADWATARDADPAAARPATRTTDRSSDPAVEPREDSP